MKIDSSSKHKCPKCKEVEFSCDKFESKWDAHFGLYRNIAIGSCGKCGAKGHFLTSNTHKYYGDANEAHV